VSTAQALPADDADDRPGGPVAGAPGVRRLRGPVEALRGPLPADPLEALAAVRERTRILVGGLTRAELEEQIDPLMSPLVWDLAHIAAYEDLWLVHRHGDRPLLHPELADLYDAFETPRQARGDLELLDVPQAWAYMDEVRARVLEVVAERGGDDVLVEMVLQHELQHTETMLQAMRLGGLTDWIGALPGGDGTSTSTTGEAALHAGAGRGGAAGGATAGGDAPQAPLRPISAAARSRAEVLGGTLLRVPGGEVQVGAAPDVFSYDNERPRHDRAVAAFRIAPRPVTVAQWDAFVADGGTRDQRFWSDAGWAWRAGGAGSAVNDATGDGAGGAPGARAPEASVASVAEQVVCHLNAFQAEAFAAWAGLRLPTEAEWEHAAASGLLGDVGTVWEWTSTVFHGYPGFAAHPYKEYSEVFFDRGYRVLRGGSFAAHPRVATTTFRNWDLPERRQIFAGVRLAADAEGPTPQDPPRAAAAQDGDTPSPQQTAPTGREASA
jgi:iron(II)-dependent oxidoreductase